MYDSIDNEIDSLFWYPIHMNGDRRVIDLIIARKEGWEHISWDEEKRDWIGHDPSCRQVPTYIGDSWPLQDDCFVLVPYVHNNKEALLNRIKENINPKGILLKDNGVVSLLHESALATHYRHGDWVDNLLFIYMKWLTEKRDA